jgi:hypothetical protein
VNEADVAGQQILDAVAKNGVRMTAAELHQVIFASRVDLRDEQFC